MQTLSSCTGVQNCLKRSEQQCRHSRSGRLLRRQGPERKYLPSRHRRAQRTNISESGRRAASLVGWPILAAVERMSANFASLVVSGNTALPRMTSSLVDRGRPRAEPGGIVAGSCKFRGPEGRATGSEIRTAR